MTSTGQNFVANKDTILKEGWFKKRNFKGEIGRGYSKRWCVLTARYFEWYDFPNGQRKQTIPLDHCYVRIHEGTGLIIGSFQSSKEWLLRDEGASPAATAGEWLEAVNKAIENYRNVGGSASATGQQKGLVNLADVLAKNQPAPAPAPVAAAPMVQQQTTYQAPAAAYQAPPVTQTMVSAPPMYSPAPAVQTNYAFTPAANPGYATTYQQPAYVAPPVHQQTYVQTVAPMPMVQQTYIQQPAYVQPTVTYVQPAPMMMTQAPTMTYTTYQPMY